MARGARRGRRGHRRAHSGSPAAAGYAKASGLPRDKGLVKNRYVARTFVQPGDQLHKHGLRMKFNPLREVVEGKRLVVVDDSIVRGNTTRQIVSMLRDAGALEVHMRISAPPIRYPCHYGVDMSTKQEMVAHGRTVDEIAEELECDSIAYLSLEGVYEAIRGEAPPTATPASRATTRWSAATPPTASSPSKSSRSYVRNNPRTFREKGRNDRPGPAGSGATVAVPVTDLDAALQRNFGFSGFRAGQREACEAALPTATCWWSCPPARASRSATSCPASCAPT